MSFKQLDLFYRLLSQRLGIRILFVVFPFGPPYRREASPATPTAAETLWAQPHPNKVVSHGALLATSGRAFNMTNYLVSRGPIA